MAGAGFLIADGEVAAAVDRQIEAPVGPTEGLAEFGMVENGHRDARQWAILLIQHPPTQHGGAFRINGAGCDAGLNRVGAGVEKFSGGKDGRRYGRSVTMPEPLSLDQVIVNAPGGLGRSSSVTVPVKSAVAGNVIV